MSRTIHALVALILLTCPACDDQGTVADKPATRSVKVELKTLTSLRANQHTNLAIGARGQVYMLQPDTGDDAAVKVITSSGDVISTGLTPAAIAKALNQPTARGAMRGMVAVPGGRLLVYYSGTERAASLASLILYDPATDRITIVASSGDLAAASEMGLLLDLSRAQLVRAGASVWLWLRHVDGSAFLKIDAQQLEVERPRLSKPFNAVTENGERFKFRDEDVLFGDTDGSLRIMRPGTGVLRIDSDGKIAPEPPPRDRPRSSVPSLLLREDARQPGTRRLHFYPIEELPSAGEISPLADGDALRYPAFGIITESAERVYDRDSIIIRHGFPLHALRINNWLSDTNAGNVIAYDAMSGEVFSLSISAR
ncbi:MAG: hypothetical protein H7144_06135 [Burkholderiales bacterium]|nr:hypothetical protein [Phycisphaerae bacterium]